MFSLHVENIGPCLTFLYLHTKQRHGSLATDKKEGREKRA